MSNDWTSRSGIEEKLLSLFAMSYGVCVGAETTGVAHDLGHVVDTCSAADSAVSSVFYSVTGDDITLTLTASPKICYCTTLRNTEYGIWSVLREKFYRSKIDDVDNSNHA